MPKNLTLQTFTQKKGLPSSGEIGLLRGLHHVHAAVVFGCKPVQRQGKEKHFLWCLSPLRSQNSGRCVSAGDPDRHPSCGSLSPSRWWEVPGCRYCSCWSAVDTQLLFEDTERPITEAAHRSVHASLRRGRREPQCARVPSNSDTKPSFPYPRMEAAMLFLDATTAKSEKGDTTGIQEYKMTNKLSQTHLVHTQNVL